MADDLSPLAISVRQPWAWALLHAGKDVENRPLLAPWKPLIGKRVAIHASKGMTRAEYLDAAAFFGEHGFAGPNAADLPRGGIVGSVLVIGVTAMSDSKWFFGPYGIVVRDPVALATPIPCSGALGVFDWRRRLRDGETLDAAKPWMVKA